MWRRLLLLFAVAAGCISGFFIGTAASLATDSAFYAFLFAVAFPILAARLAGLRNPDRLTLLGVYAIVGWVLGYSLPPAVAGIRGPDLLPGYFANDRAFLFGLSVSMLLSLIGATFAPREQLRPLGKRERGLAAVVVLLVAMLTVPSVAYLRDRPTIELESWTTRMNSLLNECIDKAPVGGDPKEWNRLVASTQEALSECFGNPNEIIDRGRLRDFGITLRVELATEPSTLSTLAWIWDEIEIISSRGKEYSAKHRPELLTNFRSDPVIDD